MKKLALLLIVFVSVLTLAQNKGKASKPDPWAGTWILDTGKSKFPDAAHAPKAETVQSQGQPPGSNIIKFTVARTNQDGSQATESYDGKSDGQPYPFLVNGQEVAKVAYTKVNDHQYASKGTGADGSSTTGTVTLSKDGKTITIKEHGKALTGEFDVLAIYNKGS